MDEQDNRLAEAFTVRSAAQTLIKRAVQVGQHGTLADPDALQQLDRELDGRLPTWYAELLATVPLSGLYLGWQAYEPKADFDGPEDDFDGIEWLKWSDSHNIRVESLESYPGIAILKRGYINVALDTTGGGDPYFIPTDQGDDPPLFQVYHDVSEDPDVIVREGRRLIAASLSEFFRTALVLESMSGGSVSPTI